MRGAEPPGPREVRPEDKLSEAMGGAARAPLAVSPLRFAPLRSANPLPHDGGGNLCARHLGFLSINTERLHIATISPRWLIARWTKWTLPFWGRDRLSGNPRTLVPRGA